jgi:hypothetical protein
MGQTLSDDVSDISKTTSEDSHRTFHSEENLSIISPIEQKLCVLCKQKINSRDYVDHVTMCNGQQKFSSISISSSNERNKVSNKNNDQLSSHHQLSMKSKSVDENNDSSIPRINIPPKVKFT